MPDERQNLLLNLSDSESNIKTILTSTQVVTNIIEDLAQTGKPGNFAFNCPVKMYIYDLGFLKRTKDDKQGFDDDTERREDYTYITKKVRINSTRGSLSRNFYLNSIAQ